jgi:peptidoglycan hydrolase-like protein with peptidoglycan-binding domain
MKMRHVVAVTSAVLVSFGALAGGQQHSSAGASAEPATVRQAQERLMSEGFDPGAVDGRLGPQTQQGLKDFQASRGLEPSGQLDPQTVAALGLESDSSAATGGSASDAGQPAPERGAAEPASGDYSS